MNNKVMLAEEEFAKGNLEACSKIVDEAISMENTDKDALMLRAKLNYRFQKWGDSLNDLNKIIDMDSSHELAKNYKQMVLNILKYWNKDNYNP